MLSERWQTLTTGMDREEPAAQALPGLAAELEDVYPLCFEGPDVVNFLQGYLTIDLEQLADGEPKLAALTNLQGRVVASGWAQMRNTERLDWLIHRELIEPVSSFMARYLAFSKTKLIEPEPDHLVLGCTDAQGNPDARLICSEQALDALMSDHQPATAAEWHSACIQRAAVLINPETTEAFLPQMVGLVEAGAVDFDKGCYLGQEVVARAQHRGEVKRRAIQLTGVSGPLPAGAPVLNGSGKEVGRVLMSQAPLCLAVVRQPSEDRYRVGESELTAL